MFWWVYGCFEAVARTWIPGPNLKKICGSTFLFPFFPSISSTPFLPLLFNFYPIPISAVSTLLPFPTVKQPPPQLQLLEEHCKILAGPLPALPSLPRPCHPLWCDVTIISFGQLIECVSSHVLFYLNSVLFTLHTRRNTVHQNAAIFELIRSWPHINISWWCL